MELVNKVKEMQMIVKRDRVGVAMVARDKVL